MLRTCCAWMVLLVLGVHVSLCEGLTISGTIRNPMGGGLSGVSLIRASHGGGSVSADGSGNFTLTVTNGWSGFIVVERDENMDPKVVDYAV